MQDLIEKYRAMLKEQCELINMQTETVRCLNVAISEKDATIELLIEANINLQKKNDEASSMLVKMTKELLAGTGTLSQCIIALKLQNATLEAQEKELFKYRTALGSNILNVKEDLPN